jgi:hypothetical protein
LRAFPNDSTHSLTASLKFSATGGVWRHVSIAFDSLPAYLWLATGNPATIRYGT